MSRVLNCFSAMPLRPTEFNDKPGEKPVLVRKTCLQPAGFCFGFVLVLLFWKPNNPFPSQQHEDCAITSVKQGSLIREL